MTDSCFFYFLRACFTRYRDHQGVDLNKITHTVTRKAKIILASDVQCIILSQPAFFTNRVTVWQCGDNKHSSREKENDVRSFRTAICLPLC